MPHSGAPEGAVRAEHVPAGEPNGLVHGLLRSRRQHLCPLSFRLPSLFSSQLARGTDEFGGAATASDAPRLPTQAMSMRHPALAAL